MLFRNRFVELRILLPRPGEIREPARIGDRVVIVQTGGGYSETGPSEVTPRL